MAQQIEVEKDSGWRRFLRKHWGIFALFVVAAILAAAGAIYVFVWFVRNAQSSGLVPSVLGMWTMGNMVTFILNALFWELILVGIPVTVGAILGWQWWKRLPEGDKKEHLFGERSRSRGAGGAISPLLFIAFALKVYVDGNWNVPIATWNLDYVVGSMVTILIWIVAIFAIPAMIGLIWWIHHEITKKNYT